MGKALEEAEADVRKSCPTNGVWSMSLRSPYLSYTPASQCSTVFDPGLTDDRSWRVGGFQENTVLGTAPSGNSGCLGSIRVCAFLGVEELWVYIYIYMYIYICGSVT